MINERFWNKVDIKSKEECWNWKGYKNSDGYGHMTQNGKYKAAHRLAYELTYGTIPEGLLIMHLCDNPSCCNPNHLKTGTNKDNSQDMKRKGRSAGGLTSKQKTWYKKL